MTTSRFYLLFSSFCFFVFAFSILFSSFYFLDSFLYAHAASVRFYFEGPNADVAPASDVVVRLLVDSAVPVNAFEALLEYDPRLLTLEEARDVNSILLVWPNRPILREPGTLYLTGGTPQPFRGVSGELLTLRFTAVGEGDAAMRYGYAGAYIADGKGTRADGVSESFTVRVREGASRARSEAIADSRSPRVVALQMFDDPLNSNQKLVSFDVRDAETGIRGTLVRIRTWFFWSNWIVAQNPVAIPKDAWAVEMLAQDNAGNSTAQIIYNWPGFMRGLIVPLLLALGAVCAIFFLVRRLVTH